ncbi:alpha/beta fold hydrolase [cf. Phormidesmis sp. LEGE 11477]|uniref:thioesterase II family protein n=1 Tax=cf. Phormidesmis sp. LEGE 11477 TaxID=1828680 RepID=UPI00188237C0|nr:thioesterase [cf. Phormidesmis sp. LEGE 11477]
MTNWLVCSQRRVRPQLRLFCFPYAGGSAWMFRSWASQLPESIEIIAVELPGRGKRLAEPALTDLAAIVQALGPQLLPHLNVPFAVFGHSMGALVAFETCQWLRRSAQITPVHFWAAAARAPHLAVQPPLMHTLDDDAFINRLKQYKGTPTSVLNNTELMALMVPTLRADFAVLETYTYQSSTPFPFPITGLWGESDAIVSKTDVAAWQTHTPNFILQAIAGHHFFIHQSSFANTLIPTLKPLLTFDE